jgi:hypothetical protein
MSMQQSVMSEEYKARLTKAEAIASQIVATHPDFDPLAENAYPLEWDALADAIDPEDHGAQQERLFQAIRAALPADQQHLLGDLDAVVGACMAKMEDALHVYYRAKHQR